MLKAMSSRNGGRQNMSFSIWQYCNSSRGTSLSALPGRLSRNSSFRERYSFSLRASVSAAASDGAHISMCAIFVVFNSCIAVSTRVFVFPVPVRVKITSQCSPRCNSHSCSLTWRSTDQVRHSPIYVSTYIVDSMRLFVVDSAIEKLAMGNFAQCSLDFSMSFIREQDSETPIVMRIVGCGSRGVGMRCGILDTGRFAKMIQSTVRGWVAICPWGEADESQLGAEVCQSFSPALEDVELQWNDDVSEHAHGWYRWTEAICFEIDCFLRTVDTEDCGIVLYACPGPECY